MNDLTIFGYRTRGMDQQGKGHGPWCYWCSECWRQIHDKMVPDDSDEFEAVFADTPKTKYKYCFACQREIVRASAKPKEGDA
jgi:DNA-directed RNA polymerase subunit RPC12/RpoP